MNIAIWLGKASMQSMSTSTECIKSKNIVKFEILFFKIFYENPLICPKSFSKMVWFIVSGVFLCGLARKWQKFWIWIRTVEKLIHRDLIQSLGLVPFLRLFSQNFKILASNSQFYVFRPIFAFAFGIGQYDVITTLCKAMSVVAYEYKKMVEFGTKFVWTDENDELISEISPTNGKTSGGDGDPAEAELSDGENTEMETDQRYSDMEEDDNEYSNE